MLVALSVLATVTAAPEAAVRWAAPVPSWVTPRQLEAVLVPIEMTKTQSVLVEIDDEQAAMKRETERYRHHAEQALQPLGLEQVSELHIDFDPSYERLLLHRARVVRGGKTVFAAGPKDVRFASKDSSFGSRLFTNEVSATIILKDVRVGDTVETAYTIAGSNPVFGGKLSAVFGLDVTQPTLFHRVRIVAPPNAVQVATHNAAAPETQKNAHEEAWTFTETRDVAHAARPSTREDATPFWYDDWPHVEVSAYATWADVVRWGVPLYRSQALGRLDALAEWKRLQTQEEKLLAALRFVQNEVRYLGFELGPHSHQPHAPATVLKERLGDCKDKTYLLMLILKELGIDAAPALVSTYLRRGLDSVLPTPLAFNHVIVRATLPSGAEHYVDPTWTHQRGSLDAMTSVDYERALILKAGETALREIPRHTLDVPLFEISERFVVPSFASAVKDSGAVPDDAKAELFRHTIFRGERADAIRGYFATEQREDVTRQFEENTAKEFEGATLAEPYTLKDDADANVIQTWTRYTLPAFWVDNVRDLPAHALADDWPSKLRTVKRKTPFAIASPVNVSHHIDVALPGPWELPDFGARVDNAFFSFQRSSKVDGAHVSMSYSLRTKTDHAAPSDAEAYNRAVGALEGLYSVELYHAGEPTTSRGATPEDFGTFFSVLAVAVVGFFGVGFARRRLKRFFVVRKYAHRAGESAETALPASAALDVDGLIASRTCACGKRLQNNGTLRKEAVRLGNLKLRSFEIRCAFCQKLSVVYVRDT
ncbi:MAG: DUF3857 domain-containing protein [Deltaproteobacteria bacterium]|nr:DUF3857 domain-containing protein [Deltaproteobacteria bacterium]